MKQEIISLISQLHTEKPTKAHLIIDHLNDLAESRSLSIVEANAITSTLVQFWQENPSYDIEESVLSFFISAVVFSDVKDTPSLLQTLMAKPNPLFKEYYEEISSNHEFNVTARS